MPDSRPTSRWVGVCWRLPHSALRVQEGLDSQLTPDVLLEASPVTALFWLLPPVRPCSLGPQRTQLSQGISGVLACGSSLHTSPRTLAGVPRAAFLCPRAGWFPWLFLPPLSPEQSRAEPGTPTLPKTWAAPLELPWSGCED